MPQAQQQGTIRDVEPEIARLAERGWRLFPCAVGGKKPLLKGWPTKASFIFR